MKKILVFFNIIFVCGIGTAVASEILQSIKEENSFISQVSNDVALLCKGYEKPLDELLDALEKCANDTRNDLSMFPSESESCARCLPIMAKPEHVNFDKQMKNTLDSAYDSLINKDEKHVQRLSLAIQEKMGDEFIEKVEKRNDLSDGSGRQLYASRSKMIRDIDLSQFNALLPDILRDACEQPQGELGKNQYCAEIQQMFQIKRANLNGEYSPFSANIARQGDYACSRVVLGTVATKPDDLEKKVEYLCSHLLKLSEQTTNQLVQLTMDGYNGDGKCEKGPVLDLQQEQEIWKLEKDQRTRKNIAQFVRKQLEKGAPSDQISSSLYMLRSNTPECRKFEGNQNMETRLACQNTPECQAYDRWMRITELEGMIAKIDDEQKKKELKEEQRDIAMKLLGNN